MLVPASGSDSGTSYDRTVLSWYVDAASRHDGPQIDMPVSIVNCRAGSRRSDM